MDKIMRNRTGSPAIMGGIILAAFLLVSIATAIGNGPDPTVPNFIANVTSGYAPLTVLFTDTSQPGSLPREPLCL
jgi:PKD repeat protein